MTGMSGIGEDEEGWGRLHAQSLGTSRVDDIADVAVAALTEAGHGRQRVIGLGVVADDPVIDFLGLSTQNQIY